MAATRERQSIMLRRAVAVAEGTVALQGYIEPEDAFAVLDDLRPSTIDDIAALSVKRE